MGKNSDPLRGTGLVHWSLDGLEDREGLASSLIVSEERLGSDFQGISVWFLPSSLTTVKWI